MKCQTPQISWHGRDPVLTVDFQVVQGGIRRLVTGGTDAHVIIWYVTICSKNTINLECACDLSRHNKSVNVVRFSPNGDLLASGDDEGGIFLWKLGEKNQCKHDSDEEERNKEDWVPLKLLRGHLDDICDLNWSPNSDYIISGSIDNCILIWDVQKGTSVCVLKEAKGFVQGVAWDPLNQYFASISSDRVARIYSVGSKKVLNRIHKAPWVSSGEKGLNKQSKLFHDDTLQSFSRRLSFSPDGNFLFVPSGIKEKDEKQIHTTYVFSRYDFGRPIFHLPTAQKYTLAVRCCPLLFKLREVKGDSSICIAKLPYRILIAVATQDSIFLYDTQQLAPFAYISNIHYTHLTDIAWSPDARMLIASSTDGYCSFIIFDEGELGEVYIPETKEAEQTKPISNQEDNLPIDKNVEGSNKLVNYIASENASDNLIVGKNDVEKSPRTPKTPQNLHQSSARKSSMPKRSSQVITSFFSPPNKKVRKDESEEMDCVTIQEKSTEVSANLKLKNLQTAEAQKKEFDAVTDMMGSTTIDQGNNKENSVKSPVQKQSSNVDGTTDSNLGKGESCHFDDIKCLTPSHKVSKGINNAPITSTAVADAVESVVNSTSSQVESQRECTTSGAVVKVQANKSTKEDVDKDLLPADSKKENPPIDKVSSMSEVKDVTMTDVTNVPIPNSQEVKPKRRIQLITLSDKA